MLQYYSYLIKKSSTSFIPDSLLSSPSSHLSRSAQRRYNTHTLPHLTPSHSAIDTTPTLYTHPTSPTISPTTTTNSPTPATTDSAAAAAGENEKDRYEQPSAGRQTELSQNIQHVTKSIRIPQALSSVTISPSSPPNQLYLSALPSTTSSPDAPVEPTQRGHIALEASADPTPSSGYKCYATQTSTQQAP
jgi:hypothetical protein